MLKLLEELRARGATAAVAELGEGEVRVRLEPPGTEDALPGDLVRKALALCERGAVALFEERGLFSASLAEGRAVFDLERGLLEVSWRLWNEEQSFVGGETWSFPLRVVLEGAKGEGEAVQGRGRASGGGLELEGGEPPLPKDRVLRAVEEALLEEVAKSEDEDLWVLGLRAWAFPFRFAFSPEEGRLTLEGEAKARVMVWRCLSPRSEEEGREVLDLREWAKAWLLDEVGET